MTNRDTVERAREMALRDEELNRNIRWWHRRKGALLPSERRKPFMEWLDGIIEHLSDQIDRWYDAPNELPPAEDIVCALRVNAEGDFLALYQEESAQSCCQTDVNCYVEEGVVYSDIWLRSDYRELTYDKAVEIADRLRGIGYAAEVCVDEEDAHEATVCAQIDFPIYRDMAISGRRAEDVFMYSTKSDTIESMPKKEKSVSDRVKDAISEVMCIDRKKVVDGASLVDDLGADDLDIIEMVMQLEGDFGLTIPESDVGPLGSVRQVVAYIEKRIAEDKYGKEEAKA